MAQDLGTHTCGLISPDIVLIDILYMYKGLETLGSMAYLFAHVI